jgi:hypothetical protein
MRLKARLHSKEGKKARKRLGDEEVGGKAVPRTPEGDTS